MIYEDEDVVNDLKRRTGELERKIKKFELKMFEYDKIISSLIPLEIKDDKNATYASMGM